jgi:hypothetical protein
MNLIWTLCLLLFSSIFAFAVPNAEPGASTLIYDHGELVQVSSRYDETSLPACDYDSAAVPVADEKEKRTLRATGALARFAQFIAAKTGLNIHLFWSDHRKRFSGSALTSIRKLQPGTWVSFEASFLHLLGSGVARTSCCYGEVCYFR